MRKSVTTMHNKMMKNEKRLQQKVFTMVRDHIESYCSQTGITVQEFEDSLKDDPEQIETFIYGVISRLPKAMVPITYWPLFSSNGTLVKLTRNGVN